YLPLGGIMVSKAIKQAMDSVKPENRWMHAYTYSAHPTCCAVAVKNLEIMTRERLWENAAKMGERLHARLTAAFRDHPHAGDVRGGKGLLAAVELVEDRASKRNFAADKKVAPRIQAEMMKRGVITRVRAVAGAHPAPGDTVYYAPPLVVTGKEVDQVVAGGRDGASGSARHADLRRRLRDVPVERLVDHAPGPVARRAGDPALPLGRARRALPPGARGRLSHRHAARPARWPRAERRRRRPRAAAPHPRLGLGGRRLRAAGAAAAGAPRVRLGRAQPHADLVRPRRPRRVSDLAAPLDVYRDVVRPEWMDHNGHMKVGYYLVVLVFDTEAVFF